MKILLAIAAGCIVFAQVTRSVWDGVYTNEQAERGKARYDHVCFNCHGEDLEGDVVEHPALVGGEFRAKWNGLDLGQLFERIHRDMPMKNAGTLSREEAAELLAFILRENEYPAGAKPLPADINVLKQIRMDARKP
jgi:mono/diheme cytochrome c family protein